MTCQKVYRLSYFDKLGLYTFDTPFTLLTGICIITLSQKCVRESKLGKLLHVDGLLVFYIWSSFKAKVY